MLFLLSSLGLSPEITMEFCVTLIIVCGIFILACQRVETMIRLFAMQSIGLVLIGFLNGFLHPTHYVWLVMLVTFLGKCVILPFGLLWVARQTHPRAEIESHLTLPVALLIGIGLVLLGFYITHGIQLHHVAMYTDLLGACLALLLLGLMTMIAHKNALSQIMGLYVLDNGIFCLAASTVFEMPLIVEMGLLMELLLSALVMGVWIFRIKKSFNSLDVLRLKQLKG